MIIFTRKNIIYFIHGDLLYLVCYRFLKLNLWYFKFQIYSVCSIFFFCLRIFVNKKIAYILNILYIFPSYVKCCYIRIRYKFDSKGKKCWDYLFIVIIFENLHPYSTNIYQHPVYLLYPFPFLKIVNTRINYTHLAKKFELYANSVTRCWITGVKRLFMQIRKHEHAIFTLLAPL